MPSSTSARRTGRASRTPCESHRRRGRDLLELTVISPHNSGQQKHARQRRARTSNIGKKRVRNTVKTAAALAAVLASAPATAAWEPTKPVEIVVAAGAGGASDQMARMMQAAIQKNNLMKQPMVVSLKGGAAGAEAVI